MYRHFLNANTMKKIDVESIRIPTLKMDVDVKGGHSAVHEPYFLKMWKFNMSHIL